ncbi:leucyl aminopeptidase [Desulfopila aestuarii]|uniref:Probable cytosol aminopeptidase n=1 Tax=Desulfopila aestuarii DSM 18488 TaxID=1121416 RepID=A0A1M7Y3Y3_9BACT|nr:leucyl aminopeptidase [Desulfopila aestuarii]SHO46960.1 leucyl aminopeptidase [Desulfopila aestuarii DSM 18488]
MHATKVTVFEKDIYGYDGDLLIFWAAGNEDGTVQCDSRVADLLQPLTVCKDFSAKENDTVVLYPETVKGGEKFSAKRILVVGFGVKKENLEEYHLREIMRSAGGAVSKVCEKLKVSDALVCVDGLDFCLDRARMVECFTEGLLLGDYRFTKYKKPDSDKPVYGGLKKLSYSVAEKRGKVRKGAKRGADVAFAVHSARDMANEPGNGWTAAHFAAHAEQLAKQYKLKCRILDKARMKRLGMGGMLAVNQGSAEPPKLVILEYTPEKHEQTVMLVGKGLTFDSGGISLKPAEGMKDMKYDMCGGAAVLAAMQAIAEDRPSVRVVALIPATDNMTGSSALKPGDVIRHYNGITSEIVSTDAEGRLILADAIAYGIKEFKPDCVVDVATLTGAVIIGLGHHHTGILGNNDQLVEQLITAGRNCGEPLWRLPLTKEYSKQIESQVADIKNTGGRPGGTITAAAYIEKFVGETAWAHLDIAGTAWDFTEKTYIPKGPSGIMVRTLVEFVQARG